VISWRCWTASEAVVEISGLAVWLDIEWLTGVMAWIGSFSASVLITLEVHMSLSVELVCVVKFAVLGAQLEKNRSTQVTSQQQTMSSVAAM
jgi:hypothetical protein